MLTPYYQEFANRAPTGNRDNSVILVLGMRISRRNPPSVAVLPRRKTGTKPELSLGQGTGMPLPASLANSTNR
jgi:hypothetical protein